MIRLSVLLVGVLCSGCFHPMEEVRLPKDTTPEEFKVFEDAAEKWCEASGRCLEVSIKDPANVTFFRDCEVDFARTVLYFGVLTIELCEGVVRDGVVLHEMGHALAPHRDDHLGPGNVMAEREKDQGASITKDDVEWLQSSPDM